MAHLARHRNSPYDSERKSEMAGQRRCAWSSTLHHRPVRHRRITESTCNRSCTAAGTALFELRNGTLPRASELRNIIQMTDLPLGAQGNPDADLACPTDRRKRNIAVSHPACWRYRVDCLGM